MNLVSIVITVFNAEVTLVCCLDGIINQTYRKLDMIIVDDGSTDRSGRVCDQYMDKDQRISVIHKENGVVSAARNSGLETVKGDLLAFCDSDDWYELNLIEKLVSEYERTDANHVLENFKWTTGISFTETKHLNNSGISLCDEKDIFRYICKTFFKWRCICSFDALYRLDII